MVMGLVAVLEMAVMLPLAVTVLVETALGVRGPLVMVLMVLMEVVLAVIVVGGGS